jgi:hypothetical protein
MAVRHPKCYAQSLGGCSSQISGEHYVSEAVLRAVSQANNRIRVQGLKFQPSGLVQEIGISNLTGNVLCDTDNSQLSQLDAVGLEFFDAMERIMCGGSLGAIDPIDGYRLEGWMLKTLTGGVFCGAFQLPEGMNLKGKPPPHGFLSVLFDRMMLGEPLGLYLYQGDGDEKFHVDHNVLAFQVSTCPTHDTPPVATICGLSTRIFGIEFYLSTLRLPSPLPGRWQNSLYRPTRVVGPFGKAVNIRWDGVLGDRIAEFSSTEPESSPIPNNRR